MKTIFRLLIVIFSVMHLSACSALERAKDDETSQSKGLQVSIAHLKSLCRGDHYRIVNDYTISGVVVTTDIFGEMNKSVVVVDDSGGVEIAIDSYNISKHLPLYSEVTILCNGLMLARVGGKIELGAIPTGDFPLDNIDEDMCGRYISVTGTRENYQPKTKRFSEIGVEDISNLIRFDNVRICDEEQGLTWCDIENGEPVTTYRTLVDGEGQTLALRVLSTCQYATTEMPTKEISVIGIIDYSDNRYFLRIVNGWFI